MVVFRPTIVDRLMSLSLRVGTISTVSAKCMPFQVVLPVKLARHYIAMLLGFLNVQTGIQGGPKK